MGEGLLAKLFDGSHRSVVTRLRQGGDGGKRFPRRWRIKDAVEPVRIEPSIAAAIYFDQGGHRTPEEAVDLFEGDATIWRRLAGSEPKAVLKGVEQCRTTLNAAAHACTYPDQTGSRFDKAELGVVGSNAVHLALGNPEV
jgi:hypothetical protein